MKKARRKFLSTAGITAIGLGVMPVVSFAASDSEKQANALKTKNKQALVAHRWGMVIDVNKITKEIAYNIIQACHNAHNVPDFDNEVDKEKYPDIRPVNHKRRLNGFGKKNFIMRFLIKKMSFLPKNFMI